MTQDIPLLLETQSFIAVSKPAGICFHNEESVDGNSDIGLVERVKTQFEDAALFPVHRLDRVTSGLMLFAKGEVVNKQLSALFQNRQIKKEYLAISHKKPNKKQGLVSGDMVKARGGSYKLTRSYDNPAITRFKAEKLNGYWLFRLWPETGKTHQLRVMCKAVGSPIIGDDRYGGSEADRCYLHAHRLEFSLEGKPYSIVDDNFDLSILGQSNLAPCTLDENGRLI